MSKRTIFEKQMLLAECFSLALRDPRGHSGEMETSDLALEYLDEIVKGAEAWHSKELSEKATELHGNVGRFYVDMVNASLVNK